MFKRLDQTVSLVKQMGVPWVLQRAGYAFRRKAGLVARSMPCRSWDYYAHSEWSCGRSTSSTSALVRQSADRFFFKPGSLPSYKKLLAQFPRQGVTEEARAAERGFFRLFDEEPIHLGNPPQWHRHPVTGEVWPLVHWTQMPEMPRSDVKWLWELARFGIAYTLVRAYWRTLELRYVKSFWELVSSWKESNPPNLGCHWACGQECAFRVLALCFGLFGFLDAESTTDARIIDLLEILLAHGERIESNLGYAVSQKNNHAVNEALALWTIGTQFPFFPRATKWEAKGREILEQAARDQFYDDGSYVQHSLNYHRLVLQSYSWALQLAENHHRPFSDSCRNRVSQATEFLFQITDPISGHAPNYGSNDGAVLWRLDDCPFQDQRGAIATAAWVTNKRRVHGDGPWDESLFWIGGDQALASPGSQPLRVPLAARSGGYYTLRGLDTWAFTRCCTYRDRPAQADMLHVDIWWRGHNLIGDPGTYSYAGTPPWNNGLSGTGVHNAALVNRADQMERGPRFLWFHWTRGTVKQLGTFSDKEIPVFVGEHQGFQRRFGVTHRRSMILVDGTVWVIVDDLLGEGEHTVSTSWLYPRAQCKSLSPLRYQIDTAVGWARVSHNLVHAEASAESPLLEYVHGSKDSTLGWFCSCYAKKEAATTVLVTHKTRLPMRQVTLIGLEVEPTQMHVARALKHLQSEVNSHIP